MGATPGWYPDPSGAGGQRYFDGAQWTEQHIAAHKTPSKRWIWAVVTVAVLAFGGCVALTTFTAGQNSGDGHTPGTGGQAAASAGIGTPVSDGQFTFVVDTAGPPTEHWYGQRPQGQWFIVTMKVTNTGDAPQSFMVGNQKLIDSAGRQFAPDSSQSMVTETRSFMADLNPGFAVTAKLMFDVPPGTPVSAVELHDSMFSGGAKVSVGSGGG